MIFLRIPERHYLKLDVCVQQTQVNLLYMYLYAWCVIKNKNIFDLISQKCPIFKKNHKVKNWRMSFWILYSCYIWIYILSLSFRWRRPVHWPSITTSRGLITGRQNLWACWISIITWQVQPIKTKYLLLFIAGKTKKKYSIFLIKTFFNWYLCVIIHPQRSFHLFYMF